MIHEAQVHLAGYVATEPRFKKVAGDTSFVRLRVAYTARRRDKETGEWSDGPTSFVTIQCWRTLADNVSMSVHKGEPVLIMGRLQIRRFEDAEGAPRTAVEVEASSVGHDLTRGVAHFSRTRWPAASTAAEAAALPDGAPDPRKARCRGTARNSPTDWSQQGARMGPRAVAPGPGTGWSTSMPWPSLPGNSASRSVRRPRWTLRRMLPRTPGQRPNRACPPDGVRRRVGPGELDPRVPAWRASRRRMGPGYPARARPGHGRVPLATAGCPWPGQPGRPGQGEPRPRGFRFVRSWRRKPLPWSHARVHLPDARCAEGPRRQGHPGRRHAGVPARREDRRRGAQRHGEVDPAAHDGRRRAAVQRGGEADARLHGRDAGPGAGAGRQPHGARQCGEGRRRRQGAA